ncbi:MAG: DUF2189 domain-containing protein [Rhodospirillaceae bacterium]|jgi:uncharacterized membrane protein|nr:DUF2189 domain-containing protein [Rhodospirillaceae bacterium]MBT5943934.1 DUF2189 domain-containing protein [Rhodospirillaceae bacterium]MBT6405541.1 DUF2189 domain-containing protein [Rhodospirillaceae bacterium]MBT6537020.1 DUF2189 domain-containing protein [Rhodospirillaceae bacterium]
MSVARKNQIEVQAVTTDDLLEVLGLGIRDFKAAPVYGLAFGAIYAVGGWVLILMLVEFDLPFLVYPLAAGFALIAPFIASGFYVVSSQLEKSEPLSWGIVFRTVKSMFGRDLGWMALVTGFSLFIWMDIAALLSFGFMEFQFFSFSTLLDTILTTPAGWAFLVTGHAVGALIAFGVFSYSVISIPMLFDRDIDFVTAMITSVRFVKRNPRVMAIWCFTIAALTAISLLSGFVGLLVTLPVLGHATWHLYRRAVPSSMTTSPSGPEAA